jgi:DNA modification methylase/transcriptional regulator with XRE-family HTH domain
MGKKWDYDVPSVEVWAECLRVLKHGGHLLAFAGTRTQHRMAVRIEDAGFEIRDMIAWVYGSGFPKSLDVSKAIDKRGGVQVAWFGPWFRKWREQNGINQKQVAALFPSKTGGLTGCVANWELGFNMPTPEQFNLIRDNFGLPFESVEEAEREVVGQKTSGIANTEEGPRHTIGASKSVTVDITAPSTEAAKQWEGWGTALKPAMEPITVARKPLIGTVAENVLQHGTGAINVDGGRVGFVSDADKKESTAKNQHADFGTQPMTNNNVYGDYSMVQPANYNPTGRWPANFIHDGSDEVVGLFPESKSTGGDGYKNSMFCGGKKTGGHGLGDSGSAARFFYCAKASKADRGENHHPTVKPTDLMRYLCRLVTPPNGIVLDPFNGSGSTGCAAMLEGFQYIGIEREAEYIAISEKRIQARTKQPKQLTLL